MITFVTLDHRTSHKGQCFEIEIQDICNETEAHLNIHLAEIFVVGQ